MKRSHFLVVILAALLGPPAVHAEYPNKALRFIVPYPPGGGSDALARLVGPKLSEILAQPVIIDNRTGAGANIGAELAAKSPPDGHTLLLANVAHAVNVSIYGKLGYDLVKDFAPVTLLATTPNMLVVHPSLPVKSVKDLIALAKRMPGKLDYASWGSGSLAHMAGELFDKMAGVQMSHIPYSGGGPAIIAVIGGQTPIGFPTAPAALPHMKAGKLHGLAVTNVERSAWMPELPTMSEAGLPGYEANNWMGVLVPSATPKDIVARLSSEMNKLVKVPDMKDRLRNAGMDAVGTTPEQFSSYIRSEVDKWAKIVKAVGARVD